MFLGKNLVEIMFKEKYLGLKDCLFNVYFLEIKDLIVVFRNILVLIIF